MQALQEGAGLDGLSNDGPSAATHPGDGSPSGLDENGFFGSLSGHRTEREPVLPLEMMAASAILRILPREVLDVIPRPILAVLSLDPDSPVAVNTSDAWLRLGGQGGDLGRDPPPHLFVSDLEQRFALTATHHVVRHRSPFTWCAQRPA
jgi:hypothetical protein